MVFRAIKKIVPVFVWMVSIQGVASAQINWPVIDRQAKPWARWWWPGSAVNETDLSVLLKKYREAGLGGLEITPIYGVKGEERKFISYLSPEWMSRFTYTLQQARQYDLGIDMATGTGWPFGGPWVSAEDACKNFHIKTFELQAGEQLKDTIGYRQEPYVRLANGARMGTGNFIFPADKKDSLQQYAFDQVQYPLSLPLVTVMAYSDKGEVKDLTAYMGENGLLRWRATAGNWKIYALFMGWHGKMVERAAPGGEGHVIDHFSTTALTNYLSKFDTAFQGKDIGYLRAFFNDSYEVDDARGQSNWTGEFFGEFRKRRGYDLRKELPSLYNELYGKGGSKLLYDYRLTLSELLYDNFATRWKEWAKRKGKIIRYQAHGSPANILDLYALADIPETEGDDILRFKFAVSAANITGKKLVSAEVATWLDEHFRSGLSDVKAMADRFFLAGVNHSIYHGISYSPVSAAWPGWLFYAAVHFTPTAPGWKDFRKLNAYVATCQSFLQNSSADNDILLYYPFGELLSDRGKTLVRHFDGMQGIDSTDFYFLAKELQRKGYRFDLISDKQIMNLQNEGVKLRSGKAGYKVILLPEAKSIPVETMQKIVQLAGEGAVIIQHNKWPVEVPGLADTGKGNKRLQQLERSVQYTTATTTGISKTQTGNGMCLLGTDLEKLLQYAGVNRETMVDSGIQYIRKKRGNGTEYFIVNSSGKEWNNWLSLQTGGKTAILFDPMQRVSGVAKTAAGGNGAMKVWVRLQPGETRIIRVAPEKVAGEAYPYLIQKGLPQEIRGTWWLHYLAGGPTAPADRAMERPRYWTREKEKTYQVFSGTISYSVRFDDPSPGAGWYILDLGKVKETARVLINGKELDVLIGPSYQVLVNATTLQKKNNLLEIQVSNSMVNRIIDMDKQKINWKKFYNVNFPPYRDINKGQDGLFNASGWETSESGLDGPVVLIPVTLDK